MPEISIKTRIENILLQMKPMHRILTSLAISLIAFILLRESEMKLQMLLMILWNVFAFTYNLISWTIFFNCPATQIRKMARKEDGSRVFVFIVILLASFASMLNVSLLIISIDASNTSKIIYSILAVIGMLLSWVMVHTSFCFHYAHLYYGDDENDPKIHAEGLDFPKEKRPDYIDFAYFSFVVGMTFQVSDVEITSRKIRRLALLHSLLSFGLSMFVIALTVNLIAGLKN